MYTRLYIAQDQGETKPLDFVYETKPRQGPWQAEDKTFSHGICLIQPEFTGIKPAICHLSDVVADDGSNGRMTGHSASTGRGA